jgi:hypothetical protein
MNKPSNPYRAPGAVVADPDAGGSPVRGVIYGVLVDIVGTAVATFALMVVYGIYLASTGSVPEDIETAAAQFDYSSPVGVAATAIGCGFSFLGGYVCARVARRSELNWAAVVAAISAVLGFVMGSGSVSADVNALFAALAIGCVMAGGYVGARRNARPA